MITTDLDTYRDNIKRLVEKSVFMSKELREKALKKLADPKISREKLDRMKSLLKKIIPKEDKIVKTILQKDPLFFINLKQQKSREKLLKTQQTETRLHQAELQDLEKELSQFLTT